MRAARSLWQDHQMPAFVTAAPHLVRVSMHRLGVDFRASLPQTIVALLGGVAAWRYVVRPSLHSTEPAQPALSEAPPAPRAAPPPLTKLAPPLSSHAPIVRTLDSAASLDAMVGPGLTVLLWQRGFRPGVAGDGALARAAAVSAVRAVAASIDTRIYVVDDASSAVLADALAAQLAFDADAPFACVLRDFSKTREKFLLDAVPSDARALTSLLRNVLARRAVPTRLGQARPPDDRARGGGAHVIEVVTESFDELVLASARPVIVESYTRGCETCRAFSPRLRLLATIAARHVPGLAIARIDIADNDVDRTLLSSSTLPAFNIFPGSKMLDYGGADGARVQLPTLRALLAFAAAEGGVAVPPAAFADADALEPAAQQLEFAFDQILDLATQLKNLSADDAGAAAAVKDAKRLLTAAHDYIVYDADEKSEERVQADVRAAALALAAARAATGVAL
jgi:thioredoxin 1